MGPGSLGSTPATAADGDSIKELSHRNPSHLKQMIEERHGPVVGMSEDECRDWIEQAKAHQA
jgi:hypothetical protein